MAKKAAATKKVVKKAKRKDPDCITLSSDEEDEEETVIEFEEDDEVGFLILYLLTLKSLPPHFQSRCCLFSPNLLFPFAPEQSSTVSIW